MRAAIILRLVLASATFAALAPAHATNPGTGSGGNLDLARVTSAEQIIKGCLTYTQQAQTLAAQLQQETKQAQKLNGFAEKYKSDIPTNLQPLSGAKLAAAKKTFQADLKLFALHAQEYRDHTAKIRSLLGNARPGTQAYEQNKNLYALHCLQWHIDDVAPPHICGQANASFADASDAEGGVSRSLDQLSAAEAQLNRSETRLKQAVQESGNVDGAVRVKHELSLKEQDLASEFAQLNEESKQLSVEARVLKSSGTPLPIESVKGKIKGGKREI